jgi:hypothetical protein
MKTLLAFLLCLSVTSILQSKEPDFDIYSARLNRFFKDVLFVVDVGDKEKCTKRLPEQISVFIDCNDSSLRQAAIQQLDQLCDVTGISYAITNEPSSALLKVFIGQSSELIKLSKEYSSKINLRSGRNYWIFWDKNSVINSGVIFICNDVLSKPEEQASGLTGLLMGVFGVPSHSDEFKDTCLNPRSSFTQIQPLDSRLLQFYYANIPAGMRPAEVQKVLKEKWSGKN